MHTRILKSSFLILTFLALNASAFARKSHPPAGSLIPWKQIPGVVQTTIESAANGGKIKETRKLTVNAGTVYCAEVKAADGQWTKVYATESGALLKVEPDKARNKRKHKPLFG